MIDPPRSRLKPALFFGLIAAVVYGWSLGGDFLNWDDPAYVQNNPELRSAAGLGSIFTTFHFANYNPLHRLSYWFEWQLVGESAWLFRLTNLLLHVANTVLLFKLLQQWLGRRGVALVAAALFLLHPSNVETVAWISERKSLLATAFAFGSTLCWLRGRRPLALLLFCIGLCCKTSIVPLPLFLFTLDVSRREDWRNRRGWYAAFFVAAVAAGITQLCATQSAGFVRSLHGGDLGSHLATVVAALPYYAFHLAVPFWQTPRHAFAAATLADPRCWLGVVFLAAIVLAVVRSWRGERRFAVAVVWALSALIVTLLVPIPILIADRYWYFAMPLLLGVAVDWCSRLGLPSISREAGSSHRMPLRVPLRVQGIIAGATLLLCAVVTFDYARVWRSSTALWTYTLQRSPTDVEAWISLGAARAAALDARSAMEAYGQALELDPDHIEAAESLANVELQGGRIRAARERLAALLERHPDRVHARVMFAACCDLQGETSGAAAQFARLQGEHGANVEVQQAIAAFVERHPEQSSAVRIPENAAVPVR